MPRRSRRRSSRSRSDHTRSAAGRGRHFRRRSDAGRGSAPDGRWRCRALRQPVASGDRRRRHRARSSPVSGCSTPVTRLINVLLPAPFSPTRPWISAARTSKLDVPQHDVAGKRLRQPNRRQHRPAAGVIGDGWRRVVRVLRLVVVMRVIAKRVLRGHGEPVGVTRESPRPTRGSRWIRIELESDGATPPGSPRASPCRSVRRRGRRR